MFVLPPANEHLRPDVGLMTDGRALGKRSSSK
jgi:hypothetical protein